MSTNTTDQQWADDLEDAGLGGLVGAVLDPRAHLAEAPIEGPAGGYWPRPSSEIEEVETAYDAAVTHALRALEDLLAVKPRATRAQSAEAIERAMRREGLLLAAVDRALADPESGYLRRLRARRSALLRERLAAGAGVGDLARELGVTTQRVYTLVNNNRAYVSPVRRLALEALRAEGEAARADARAARAAEKGRVAQARLAARAAEGRALQTRLDAGESMTDLAAATGYSRQKLAALLADARRTAEVAT
jgi:hypothetical protein